MLAGVWQSTIIVLPLQDIYNKFAIMKEKFMILLAALALMVSFSACNSSDEPDWKKRDVTFKANLLNHVYDSSTDKCYDLSMAENTLVFHRKDNTADITLVPGDAAFPGVSFQINGVKMDLDKDSGRYTYKSTTTPNNRVTNIAFTVDFNEQVIEVHYTVDGHTRVVSQASQVFYLSNQSVLGYNDGKDSVDKTSIYQFDIDTQSMTATMHMGPLTNTKLLLVFDNIIVRNVPITVTKDGISLENPAPETVSVYERIDRKEGTYTTVDARDDKGYQKFPVIDFKAHLMFDADVHETSFKIGRDDENTKWSVKASGQRYIESQLK